MVKEKPINIILEPKYYYPTLAYNSNSGNLKLPNLKGFAYFYGCPITEHLINLPKFIRSLCHEILHRWIHENINLKACHQWDNIDKTPDDRDYYIS